MNGQKLQSSQSLGETISVLYEKVFITVVFNRTVEIQEYCLVGGDPAAKLTLIL